MNQKKENTFSKVYLWVAEAKTIMGLFFVAFIFVYFLMGAIVKGLDVTLDLLTAIQMIAVCFFIGILKQIFLPFSSLNKAGGLLWLLTGTVIVIAFSLIFGWFKTFPLWCLIVFFIFVFFGIGAMIVYSDLRLKRETKMLNEKLDIFKNKNKG